MLALYFFLNVSGSQSVTHTHTGMPWLVKQRDTKRTGRLELRVPSQMSPQDDSL